MPEDELLLAVGTVQGLTFYPRQVDGELLKSLPVIPLSSPSTACTYKNALLPHIGNSRRNHANSGQQGGLTEVVLT